MPSSMNWVDGTAGGTPVSAANLNRLAVVADVATAGTPTGDALRAAYASLGSGGTFGGPVRFGGLKPWLDPHYFGAVANGSSHPLSEVYGTLTAAQAAFPGVPVTALTQERDWAALQYAINLLPTSGASVGGGILIDGQYMLGTDGIVSTTPSVRLFSFLGQGYSATAVARITGSGTQWLFDIGSTSSTSHLGWVFDGVALSDSVGTCAGGVRLKRTNFSRFNNVYWDGFTTGTALLLDGTGDTCQYTEINHCRGRGLFKAVDYIFKADDTVVFGGSFYGTNASGSVGLHVGSSMRAIGADVQGFQTWNLLDGNGPMLSLVRGDASAGTADVCVDVAATATDARLISPSFGGTFPTTAHIRVQSGALRTQIVAPSTGGATGAVTVDSGTGTTVLSYAEGLRLQGDAKLTRGAGGTLVAVNGFATKTKSGAVSDADFSAAPPDGTLGVDTADGAFQYRAGGAWKSLTPSTGASAPGLYAATSTATVSNTTTETILDTYTLSAGAAAVGTTLRINASGQTDNIATSGNLVIRLRIGGVAGLTVGQWTLSSAAAARTLSGWTLDAQLTFKVIGSSGRVSGGGVFIGVIGTGNALALPNSQAPATNVNTGASQDIVLTAAWATADPGNVVRRENASIELTKA